ncbi:MAG: hypothetical protein ACT4PV_07875 [Planctomycetaceae bacterium]
MISIWILLLLGPAQTLSGKYIQHGEEYLAARPRPALVAPAPLPGTVQELCALVEGGAGSPAVFEALGEALLARGEGGLAFRAFDKASRLDHPDKARLERRKDACGARIAPRIIEAEEAEARLWVEALQRFEREQLAAGRDPDDLAAFHARHGRPEEDMFAVRRGIRWSFVGGAAGFLAGLAFLAASRRLPRLAALLPAGIAAACLLGPRLLGQTGILPWGSGMAAAGAVAVLLLGRSRA